MSYRLRLYQVNLANFYKVLGSKDGELVDKAFEWLEKHHFIHLEQSDTKAIPDMCRIYLKRLVYEGRIGEKLSPKDYWTEEQLEAFKDYKESRPGFLWVKEAHPNLQSKWYEELEQYSQSTLYDCVETLFELNPANDLLFDGRYAHYYYAFKILKETGNMTAEEETLWNYVLNGRSFLDEPYNQNPDNFYQDYASFCGYLTHEELLIVIQNLAKFLDKLKNHPEEILLSEMLKTELDEVECSHSAFTDIAQGGHDMFFVTG